MFKSYIIVLLVSMKKKNYIFIILVAFSSPVFLSTIAMHPSKIQVPLKQPGFVFLRSCSAAADGYEGHSQTAGKAYMNEEYETFARCCISRSVDYSSISLRPTSLHSIIHRKGNLSIFTEA